MNEVMKELEEAFGVLAEISVRAGDVERMVLARQKLREAYKLCQSEQGTREELQRYVDELKAVRANG